MMRVPPSAIPECLKGEVLMKSIKFIQVGTSDLTVVTVVDFLCRHHHNRFTVLFPGPPR